MIDREEEGASMIQGIEQGKTEPSALSAGANKRSMMAFPEKTEKRLRAYAKAAGAMGGLDLKALVARAVPAGAISLGLLGGADVAWAGTIVYTKADITIQPVCILSGGCYTFSKRMGSLAIDLNHDGVNDFNFIQQSHRYIDWDRIWLSATALGSNDVAKGSKGARALSKGAPIGKQLKFGPGSLMAGTYHDFYVESGHQSQFFYGSWVNRDRYLGLEFQLDGSTHFGWAEFNVTWSDLFLTATLEGYAYDTVPGQGLLAGQTSDTPEPGTLGLLALGSLGLGFWRRKKAARTSVV